MTGEELISQERERQITQEGWTPKHDDEHVDGELLDAAYCYLYSEDVNCYESGIPFGWPWEPRSWKPSEDIIINLVKAGALIAAEIDRLKRKTNESK